MFPMTKRGNKPHEKALSLSMLGHRLLGHRVIDLQGKTPDAIEVYIQNGKPIINVIEVMSGDTKKRSNQQRYHVKIKKELYENLGFDNVFIYEVYQKDSQALKRIEFLKSIIRFEKDSKGF